MADVAIWHYDVPVTEEKPTPPNRPASDFPLGTKATSGSSDLEWWVVWDNQDRKHAWNLKNEDI